MGIRKRLLLVVPAALLFLAPARTAQAASIDLGHPSAASFFTDALCSFGVQCDRSVVFDVVTGFSIASAGIRFDPLAGAGSTLFVDIYASNLNASFSNGSATHGALLATASASITDVGLGFYDVPIAFAFIAGNRYDLAFRAGGAGWSVSLYNMEFYNYNFAAPGGPYAAGPVSVVDGACHDTLADCSNYDNTVMPHVRFDGAVSAVPEPSTWLLLATGLAAVAARRRFTKPT